MTLSRLSDADKRLELVVLLLRWAELAPADFDIVRLAEENVVIDGVRVKLQAVADAFGAQTQAAAVMGSILEDES